MPLFCFTAPYDVDIPSGSCPWAQDSVNGLYTQTTRNTFQCRTSRTSVMTLKQNPCSFKLDLCGDAGTYGAQDCKCKFQSINFFPTEDWFPDNVNLTKTIV